MIRYLKFTCLAASLGLGLGCERGSSIESETRDLAEAQNNTANVAKDLEARLQEAKAEVVELEKKLALAREGVTDDVMKERSELESALQNQREQVQREVSEARREAQVLNKDQDRAMQQLQQTQPPAQVDTRLKTETDVVHGANRQSEAPTREEIVPVRGGPEEQPAEGAGRVESTTSTTRSAPTRPGEPDDDRPAEPQRAAPGTPEPPAPGDPARPGNGAPVP